MDAELRARVVKALRAEADRIETEGLGRVDCWSVTPNGLDAADVECARATALVWCEPDGEWPAEIDEVAWGVLVTVEEATMVDQRPDPEGRWDYLCDYELRPAHRSGGKGPDEGGS